MSTKTPSRVSKRTRGESADEVPSIDSLAPRTPAATSKKAKKAEGVQTPAAPKSNKPDTIAEEPATSKKSKASGAALTVESSSNSGASLASIQSLLDTPPSSSLDSVEIASQFRQIQQVLLKVSNVTPPVDLLHPSLWPALTQRLQLLQANTVRVDLHLLTAIGRTITEMIASASRHGGKHDAAYQLLPTLHQLFLILLPSPTTSITDSWSATFRPTYDFFIGFHSNLIRQVASVCETAPLELFQFVAATFDSYMLMNASQTTQRKTYDTALQERNLPMWSQLHYQLSALLVQSTEPMSSSLRLCASKIEQSIDSVLFHSEHLNLYADALGNTVQEEEAAEVEHAQADAEEAKAAAAAEVEGDANMTNKDETPVVGEDANEPSLKKAKLDKENKVRSTKSTTATTAKSTSGVTSHKAHPMNYTKKLFDAIAVWLKKDSNSAAATQEGEESKPKDKKRKQSESTPSSETSISSTPIVVPFTSRAIRASLPLLFGGYVRSSETQFQLFYPTTNVAERESSSSSSSTTLIGSELRRKQTKERLKSARELQFLQAMWSLNEGKVDSNKDGGDIFTNSLNETNLRHFHDLFEVNRRLFELIEQYDVYKIHQDTSSSSSTTSNEFTGVKKLLASQMDKVMKVVRTLLETPTNDTARSKSSKSSKKSTTANTNTISSSLLLSLSVPLSNNILHLLQLNPEFVLKYMRGEKVDASSSDDGDSTNVWHLIWKVTEWNRTLVAADDASSSSSSSDPMSIFSPASSSLSHVHHLSQSLLRNFFKLRQYDVLFMSYIEASRSCTSRVGSLKPEPFSNLGGIKFDLPSLIRSIPPLKVPNLWTWFIKQCKIQFIQDDGEETSKYSSASNSTLIHFFVYFLDTMLVREEIALSLQELYQQSLTTILEGPLKSLRQASRKFHMFKMIHSPEIRAFKGQQHVKVQSLDGSMMMNIEGDANKEEDGKITQLDSASLFLLLHALNDVKAQCDQHTTKTYETMLQPLPTYFAAFDELSEASSSSSSHPSSSSSSASISSRLTDVIHHLASSTSEDPILLHGLQLCAIQRLKQLERFEMRNIIVNHFVVDEDEDVTMKNQSEDSDSDVDEEDDKKKAKKTKDTSKVADSTTPRVQTRSDEARTLVSFVLQHLDSCACYGATSASTHDAFQWDGAAGSLASSGHGPMAAVALWKLICDNMDVITQFATEEQRNEIVAKIIDITACRYCAASSKDAKESSASSTMLTTPSFSGSSTTSSLVTLYSLSTNLLVQPWFFELSLLRHNFLDTILARLLQFVGRLRGVLEKDGAFKEKDTNETTSSTLRIPKEFRLSTTVGAKELGPLSSLAERLSDAAAAAPSKKSSKSSGTTSHLAPSDLWQSIWLIQLVRSLPGQYLSTVTTFHSIIIQLLWTIEVGMNRLGIRLEEGRSSSSSSSQETLSLCQLGSMMELAPNLHLSSLSSHLLLASRRLLCSSLTLLTSPSILSNIFTPTFGRWFVEGGVVLSKQEGQQQGVDDAVMSAQHRRWSQQVTSETIKKIASILANRNGKEQEDEKVTKKDKKSSSTSSSSSLLPILQYIDSIFSNRSSSTTTSLVWSLTLASSIVESFILDWKNPSTTTTTTMSDVVRNFRNSNGSNMLNNTFKEWLKHVSHKEGRIVKQAEKEQEIMGGLLELHAHLLVAFFVGRSNETMSDSNNKVVASTIESCALEHIEDGLERATRVLASNDSATTTKSSGLTFLHALCVMTSVLPSTITVVRLSNLLRSSLGIDLERRLETLTTTTTTTSSHEDSTSMITTSVKIGFISIINVGTMEECETIVGELLDQLDVATSYSTDTSSSSLHQVIASLQLLGSYVTNAYTSSQRRAFSHSRLSLLLYRMGRLASTTINDVLGGGGVGGDNSVPSTSLTLLYQCLHLLGSIVSRPQVYTIDDQAMALIAHVIVQIAAVLNKFESQQTTTNLKVGILYHPLYIVLYGLLKHHPTSLVKIIPIYLGLLRILLAWQWRQVQNSTTTHMLPLVTSENLGRLLEELGRPSNSKVFNKYLVGLLLDWTNISKHKGVNWGQPHQEAHQKAINKGWFAIINLCEEHDLSFLHNLLDPSGRSIFRTLHQAYKKTRFTGLV